MHFSELKLISEDAGLEFDGSYPALIGEREGLGVTVTDTDGIYEIRIFAEDIFKSEKELFSAVCRLSESLPKNTMLNQSCEVGYLSVKLDKFRLLQENIVFLKEFLDKLTLEISEKKLKGTKASLPKKAVVTEKSLPKNARRLKLSFSKESLFGLIGAVLGAIAVTALAIFAITPETEEALMSVSFSLTFAPYIVAAAAAIIIFSDYRFLSRKLDAFGVILCPILTILTVVFSGFGITVKGLMNTLGIDIGTAIGGFPEYLSDNGILANFFGGYIMGGIILSVLASIFIYIFYFSRHPEETENSEKIILDEVRKAKK